MPIDFPSGPTLGQIYQYAGVTYTYTAQGVWATTGIGLSGSLAVSSQIFIGNGTYVPNPNMVSCIIECIGGGGAGGACYGAGNTYVGAGGGGSGGYSRKYATAAVIGASQTVTIGQGGAPVTNDGGLGGTATSVGTLCIANGGGGGQRNLFDGVTQGLGGLPASTAGAVGDLVFGGSPGGDGHNVTGIVATGGGTGGSSAFGGGARTGGFAQSTGFNGLPGGNYGSGGSGANTNNYAVWLQGGAGSPGVVIITEFGGVAGPKGDPGTLSVSGPLGPPQGRLSLVSATPIMTTTQSAKTAIFYTLYNGNLVPIYNGTNWNMTTFTELTIALNDTTQNPAAVGANQVHDWFVWSRSGTLVLSHGPAWTNDTTRSAGTVLARQNGVLMNNVTIGNGSTTGPAALRGTYVGTTRSNASSQLDWIYGTSAVGGGRAWFGVWNYYNRMDVTTEVLEAQNTWAPVPSAARPFNNSVNNRVSAVIGIQEDAVAVYMTGYANQNDNWSWVGVGYDSITAASGLRSVLHSVTGEWCPLAGSFSTTPAPGFHFWQAMEASGTANGAFGGDYSAAVPGKAGLSFNARM